MITQERQEVILDKYKGKLQTGKDAKFVDLPKVIGKGYKDFWNFKGRYRVVKGGRGSKKSTTASLWYIANMMSYNVKYGAKPNVLVVRKTFKDHQRSTFQQLKWACSQLGVEKYWKWTVAPLQGVYLPTGQKIMFAGLNDPDSIKSITVEDGDLCWVWVEEAYQIADFEQWRIVEMSVARSIKHPMLFPQFTFVFNPTHESSWLKREFFDKVNPLTGYNEVALLDEDDNVVVPSHDIMAITRNYDCNEFLDVSYHRKMEELRLTNPRAYRTDGLGEWGQTAGLVFQNWKVENFEPSIIKNLKDRFGRPIYTELYGADWGFRDPTAFAFVLASKKEKKIYIFDEIYGEELSNDQIRKAVEEKGIRTKVIIADSADARTINELRNTGDELRIPRIQKVRKSPDFKIATIRKISDYEIIIHPDCLNATREFATYAWVVDRDTGKQLEQLPDGYDHYIDAFIYAMSEYAKGGWSFSK